MTNEIHNPELSGYENKKKDIPKYTLRIVATYMLANGILLLFIPQFFSVSNFGFIALVLVLYVFVILNVVSAIQIYRKKKEGLILGAIGLVPFCFGLSIEAFRYKFQTLFDIFLKIQLQENYQLIVGFNLKIIANRIEAYVNVDEIGIAINFVPIVALFLLLISYLKEKETGQFPIKSY